MKKVIFAIAVLLMMFSCANHVNTDETKHVDTDEIKHVVIDEIKKGIIEVETKRLPLTIQKLDNVNDIRIDSIVIINNVEPYSGYLVTTWVIEKEDDWDTDWDSDWNDNWDKPVGRRTKQETKTVYVEVNNIQSNTEDYSWKTNWFGAYVDIN